MSQISPSPRGRMGLHVNDSWLATMITEVPRAAASTATLDSEVTTTAASSNKSYRSFCDHCHRRGSGGKLRRVMVGWGWTDSDWSRKSAMREVSVKMSLFSLLR